jgi:hypothetical protein
MDVDEEGPPLYIETEHGFWLNVDALKARNPGKEKYIDDLLAQSKAEAHARLYRSSQEAALCHHERTFAGPPWGRRPRQGLIGDPKVACAFPRIYFDQNLPSCFRQFKKQV